MADSLIGPSISTAIGWKEYEAGRSLLLDQWRGQNRPLSVGDCVEAGVVAASAGRRTRRLDSTRLDWCLQDIISGGD